MCLGGGFLAVDHQQKLVRDGGESDVLGRAPWQLVQNSLALPGYRTEVYGNERGKPKAFTPEALEATRRWLIGNGFELVEG